ncbi:hypothetical protein K353_04625 [Kitasatospora sp. SolWspMP-SS2h]|nr:hypothetical protein K353_04625 [Kitasatospora sp. SolWspMP-SS2h]
MRAGLLADERGGLVVAAQFEQSEQGVHPVGVLVVLRAQRLGEAPGVVQLPDQELKFGAVAEGDDGAGVGGSGAVDDQHPVVADGGQVGAVDPPGQHVREPAGRQDLVDGAPGAGGREREQAQRLVVGDADPAAGVEGQHALADAVQHRLALDQQGGDVGDGGAGGAWGEVGVDVGAGGQGAVARGLGDDRQRCAPAARAKLAARWRRSWRVMGGAGFVAEQVEAVEDVLGVQGSAVVVEGVAAAAGVAEGGGAGAVVECGGGAVGEGDPSSAVRGLRGGGEELVVVDGGEGVADEQGAFGLVDVVPAEGECFAFAQAGGDREFGEVGVEGVGGAGQAHEADGLGFGPQVPGRKPDQDRPVTATGAPRPPRGRVSPAAGPPNLRKV